jgi:DNA-binding NarL/FixJ family response regulator
MWKGHNTVLSPTQVAHRAGGRRLYNAVRQLRAKIRQGQVARLLAQGERPLTIAARLATPISTIRGYIHALLRRDRTRPGCPTCGRAWDAAVPPGHLP